MKKPTKKRFNLPVATGDSMRQALGRGVFEMHKDPSITASDRDAGFIVVGKIGARVGYQVFARLVRFDEKRLIDHPETGGLLTMPANPIAARK